MNELKTEPQSSNKKFKPSTARKFNMYKAQFLPLNANDSDALEDILRKAYEYELTKNQNQSTSL